MVAEDNWDERRRQTPGEATVLVTEAPTGVFSLIVTL